MTLKYESILLGRYGYCLLRSRSRVDLVRKMFNFVCAEFEISVKDSSAIA